MRIRSLAITALLCANLAPALAQEDRMQDAIVVTGMRINADSSLDDEIPNIRLRVPADFVLFEASFVNADLEPNSRKSDLGQAFKAVLKADTARTDIQLSIGDSEESFPIESVTFDEIYSPYGQRSSFNLAMHVDVRDGDTYDDVRVRAESFMSAIPEFGRVQYYIDDEQYIGLRNPERYRPDLIAAIADEVDTLDKAFKASEITVFGLEKKTITQPTGALSLDVFIPYDLTIVSKR
ncbi:MAG: hypothetical protein AAF296_11905 [Pseudomonadota bacterium]